MKSADLIYKDNVIPQNSICCVSSLLMHESKQELRLSLIQQRYRKRLKKG